MNIYLYGMPFDLYYTSNNTAAQQQQTQLSSYIRGNLFFFRLHTSLSSCMINLRKECPFVYIRESITFVLAYVRKRKEVGMFRC